MENSEKTKTLFDYTCLYLKHMYFQNQSIHNVELENLNL